MRTNAESRLQNRTYKSQMKTAEKKVLSAKNRADAEEAYRAATKLLDRLAAKGIMHQNTSANHKSKLARYVRGLTL
jgi:small subunit ribosomal protein S20